MAVKKTTVAKPVQPERKEADGFLNLTIVDREGNIHKITAIVPLYLDNRVHAALLRKGGEFTLNGSVHVVDKNPSDIEL